MIAANPIPHYVRIASYGDRLMTIAEYRQREELAAMVRWLPKLGQLARLGCVTLYLRNRLRHDFGTDDPRSVPADRLDAAHVLLLELTAMARQNPDTTYDGLRVFVAETIGGGYRFPNRKGRPPRAARGVH